MSVLMKLELFFYLLFSILKFWSAKSARDLGSQSVPFMIIILSKSAENYKVLCAKMVKNELCISLESARWDLSPFKIKNYIFSTIKKILTVIFSSISIQYNFINTRGFYVPGPIKLLTSGHVINDDPYNKMELKRWWCG